MSVTNYCVYEDKLTISHQDFYMSFYTVMKRSQKSQETFEQRPCFGSRNESWDHTLPSSEKFQDVTQILFTYSKQA